MNITFKPLEESDFFLLMKWLNSPHVKKYWDREIEYNHELLVQKYGTYLKGYKLVGRVQKPINAFIIHYNENPVGYIQIYNAHDFPRQTSLTDLPENLGAVDFFIGEQNLLGKGLGSRVLKIFLENHAFLNFRYIVADPEFTNEAAVKTFENAGFVILKRLNENFLMVAHKKIARLSIPNMIALETTFKKNFLAEDRLWLFGSRADLTKKGGDIDLYIETFAKDLDKAFEMKMRFLSDFKAIIGEQKIDLVLNVIEYPHPLLIHKVALEEGVRII